MLKLLYVFTSASLKSGSVQSKVIQQINALNTLDIECKGVFFSTDEIESQPNITFIKVDRVKSKWFRTSKQRTTYHKAVLNFFREYHNNFDFVYYRYPGAHKLLLKLMKNIGSKVFFEHITAETMEIKLYSKEKPIKLNLSSILGHFEFYFAPLFREFIYGRGIRNRALFGICNSIEIGEYQNKIASKKYPIIILGDSVNVREYKARLVPPLEEEFRIVFLKGANTNADFNGLDRIFNGIVSYKGNHKIKFYLFGNQLESERLLVRKLEIESSVYLNKSIQKPEIDLLMNEMHLGIGALAVHRKGLRSTTTIKSREYFARGIPFIFGHNDPDLSKKLISKSFCLEVSANDESIDFNEIIKWYNSLNFNSNSVNLMREFASKNLDYSIKMNKLKNYLQGLKNEY